MNNQAAQTMPELPRPVAKMHYDSYTKVLWLYPAPYSYPPDGTALHTADQMHQYARDYAAALSQTAGVPSPSNWLTAMLATLPTAIMTDEKVRHIESEAYRAMERDAHRKAAAPAASGGESHPDALPDGTLSKSTAKRVDALSSNPNTVTPSLSSESAASVSERAREIRPELDWYKAQIEKDGLTVPWADEVAFLRRLADDPVLNIEQSAFLRHCADRIFATRIVDVRALCGETTDSVYSPSAAASDHVSELISADDGYDVARSRHTNAFKEGSYGDLNEQRAADRVLREAVARRDSAIERAKTALEQALTQQRGSEPCLYVKPRLVEILHKLGPAQTEHRVMVSTVPDAQYTVGLSTTPQPSADAVRASVPRDDELPGMWSSADLIGWMTDAEPGATQLLRFGRGNGDTPWILEPRIDGYWTPWHVAQRELDKATPQPGSEALRELQSACEPFIRHNSSEQFIDLRVPTSAVKRLRGLLESLLSRGG